MKENFNIKQIINPLFNTLLYNQNDFVDKYMSINTEDENSITFYYNGTEGDYAYKPKVISKSGCGPTSMAIVISALKGANYDPIDLTKYAELAYDSYKVKEAL